MTDARLDEIKARVNAATHGPWTVMPELCGPDGQGVYCEEHVGKVVEVGDPYPRGCNNPQESMEFIAAARSDVPALVAEVRRLQAIEYAVRLFIAEARAFTESGFGAPTLTSAQLTVVELLEADMDAAEKAVNRG